MTYEMSLPSSQSGSTSGEAVGPVRAGVLEMNFQTLPVLSEVMGSSYRLGCVWLIHRNTEHSSGLCWLVLEI